MFRSWAVLDGDCCCAVCPEWPPLSISLISHLTIRHVHRDHNLRRRSSSGHHIGRVGAVVDAEGVQVAPLLVIALVVAGREEVAARGGAVGTGGREQRAVARADRRHRQHDRRRTCQLHGVQRHDARGGGAAVQPLVRV